MERSTTSRGSFADALAAGGLAAFALVLVRIHAVTAGSIPAPGAAVAAGLALGLGLATWRRSGAAGHRLEGGVAAALVAATGLLGPVMLGRLPWVAAAPASALLAALVAALAVRAGLRPRASSAIPAAAALLVGIVLLPLLGPLSVALVAAALLAGACLLARPSPSDEAPSGVADLACAAAAGGAAASWCWLVKAALLHPWPFAFALAAFLLAGWRLGAAASRRLPAIAVVLAAAALAALALGGRAPLAALLASVAGSVDATRPSGGLVTVLLSAALHGLPMGAALGLLAPRSASSRGLVGVAVGLVLAWPLCALLRDASAVTALALVVAALVGAFAFTEPARGRSLAAAGLVALIATAGAWFVTRPRTAWADRRAGAGWVAERDASSPGAWTLDGRAVGADASRAPSHRLAGHVAALLAPRATRVLVVGDCPEPLRAALESHGIATLDVASPLPSVGWAAASTGDHAPSPNALAGRDAYDAVVVTLSDPTLAAAEPFFAPSARAALASLLAPGGVLVQELDLDRLAPDELLREVALVRESLAGGWIVLADTGHDGLALVVASAPQPPPAAGEPTALAAAEAPATAPDVEAKAGAAPDERNVPPDLRGEPVPGEGATVEPKTPEPPLDLSRLLDPARLRPSVQASLREALLLGPEQLLATFVAGPAELDLLGADLSPTDPWSPGPRAFSHALPADASRLLGRALFYDRLHAIDLAVLPGAAQQPGAYARTWPFVAVETNLGTEWIASGRLRFQNAFTRFHDVPAAYRERSRRLVLTRGGDSYTVSERPLHNANIGVLDDSMAGLRGDSPMHLGTALVNEHPALWSFEQPSADEQIVTVTWHCPITERLYGVQHRITEGVRPGLFQEPLESTLGSIRCTHRRGALADASWQPFGAPSGAADEPAAR